MAILEVDNLGISFGGVRAVDGVSFCVEPGEIFSIIGPNGAGKTSLFNLVSRLYDPTDGRVVFEGRDITRIAPHEVPRLGIARTFQNLRLFERSSVLDNLMLGRYRHSRMNFLQQALFTPAMRAERRDDRRLSEDVIRLLELERFRDSAVHGLPYGVKKMIELGRALALGPKLLLLDEPSSGLNPEETRDLSYRIHDIRNDLGVTVVLIEHDMDLVGAVSDRVLAVGMGRVMALGDPDEVRSHPDVLAAYLGAPADAAA